MEVLADRSRIPRLGVRLSQVKGGIHAAELQQHSISEHLAGDIPVSFYPNPTSASRRFATIGNPSGSFTSRSWFSLVTYYT